MIPKNERSEDDNRYIAEWIKSYRDLLKHVKGCGERINHFFQNSFPDWKTVKTRVDEEPGIDVKIAIVRDAISI
jgi:hypothetical protein